MNEQMKKSVAGVVGACIGGVPAWMFGGDNRVRALGLVLVAAFALYFEWHRFRLERLRIYRDWPSDKRRPRA